MKKPLLSRISQVDIIAILAFLAVCVYHIVWIGHIFCLSDEYYYLATAQRFVFGDRPLVDDWHLAQLSCLFYILPYRVYVAIKGSTEGILLFTRYLFLTFNAVFYWVMYTKLRKFKWSALLATLMFSAYIPSGIFSFNYYNMPVRLIMLVCLILFSEKQTTVSLSVAGILLACAGVYQPLLFPLYLGYSMLVWIRAIQKKCGKYFLEDYAFCLNLHTWERISLSASLCIAAFSIWLFSRSGFKNILASIPNVLFTDPHHISPSLIALKRTIWSESINSLTSTYLGCTCLIFAFIVLLMSIVFACRVFRNRRNKIQIILFLSSCTVFIMTYIFFLRDYHMSTAYGGLFPVPLFLFGLECFLLCEQKNKPFFLFWITGLLVSLCIDFFSSTDLSYGFPITFVADIVFCNDLVKELYSKRTETNAPIQSYKYKGAKTRKFVHLFSQLICLCTAIYLVLSPLISSIEIPQMVFSGSPITSFSFPCEKGPAKHLFFTEAILKEYNNKLSDADTIKQKGVKKLFVFGLSAELYLYANLPCTGACAWLLHNPPDLEQQIMYWKQNPNNRPECIYIPVDSLANSVEDTTTFRAWIQDSLDQICKYTLEDGKAGYILYVSEWTTDNIST